MENYLITGFSGFVSKHFIEYLDSLQINAVVLGLDINEPDFNYTDYPHLKCSYKKVDLLNKGQVDNIIYQFQPNYILHLASFSSVAFSWKNPVSSFSNNTNIFLNLLEQIRELNLNCRVLSIGSSEEYGNVPADEIPLTEHSKLRPLSPYAVARVSQEMLSRIYVDGYGMDIVITRSFNHVGPGQRDVFVISSFAKQLAAIKKYSREPVITTGDLSIIRDFLDVRDVVKAYHLLLKKGISGQVYNVCSGQGFSLRKIIEKMAEILALQVTLQTDTARIRPSDNKIIIGSNSKIKEATGWTLQYPLEQSLTDILTYWSERV